MKVLAGIALLGLYLANVAEVAAYNYHVSDSELSYAKMESYCRKMGGYAAVLDDEDLEEVASILPTGFTEAYIAKNLNKKSSKIWKVTIDKKGTPVMKESSGKRKLPVICQQEESEDDESEVSESEDSESDDDSDRKSKSRRSRKSKKSTKSKKGGYAY